MLDIRSFSLGFRRYRGLMRPLAVPVLDDVSLTLARGEVLAVIGASGSGKSMLAQAVLGLLPANAETGGTIAIDGHVLDAAGRQALCSRKLALVPQSLSYLDPLARCGHQIAWAAGRAGRRGSDIGHAVSSGLARFHLKPRVGTIFPHELSGGMARRVLLAIATAGSADMVIADEPTSGLDGDNGRTVLSHLRNLADEGRAVLLITHDLSAALPFADRVAVMRGGRLQAVAPAADFAGDGEALASPYARALWQALPQNAFGGAVPAHA